MTAEQVTKYSHLSGVSTKPEESQSLKEGVSGNDPMLAGGNIGEGVEIWVTLCAQAAVEHDPKRLLELVKQINQLLDARRQRLRQEANNDATSNRSVE